jgi:hypothetical protein
MMASFFGKARVTALVRALMLIVVSAGAWLLPALASAQGMFGKGALPPRETVLPPSYPFGAAVALPASVDLRQWAVPVGNQGSTNSCTAWAIAYGLMGWYANRLNMSQNAFAPMYMYSQINTYYMYPDQRSWYCKSPDCGSFIEDGMELAYMQGVDTMADYSYNNDDYNTQPTAAQRVNAANYKFGDPPRYLSNSPTYLFQKRDGNVGPDASTAIMMALASGQPIVIAVRIGPKFDALMNQTWSNAVYSTVVNTSDNLSEGGHAMLVLGYDQTGIIVQNSWGTTWGAAGFARISWAVVQTDALEAWSANQAFHPNNPVTYNIVTSNANINGGTISPFGTLAVIPGTTKTFTITPAMGYRISDVGGTCGGTPTGNQYTTKAITASCTVAAAFVSTSTPSSYTVTVNLYGTTGSLQNTGSAVIAAGNAASAGLPNPPAGYTYVVGGTCGGAISGTTYTSSAVTANCTANITLKRSQ